MFSSDNYSLINSITIYSKNKFDWYIFFTNIKKKYFLNIFLDFKTTLLKIQIVIITYKNQIVI